MAVQSLTLISLNHEARVSRSAAFLQKANRGAISSRGAACCHEESIRFAAPKTCPTIANVATMKEIGE